MGDCAVCSGSDQGPGADDDDGGYWQRAGDVKLWAWPRRRERGEVGE